LRRSWETKFDDEVPEREHVEIEPAPTGKQVNKVPAVREERDTLIFPF